jgi:hypothetical protein
MSKAYFAAAWKEIHAPPELDAAAAKTKAALRGKVAWKKKIPPSYDEATHGKTVAAAPATATAGGDPKDTADAARAFDVIVLEGNQAVPGSIDCTQFFELLDRLGVPTSREEYSRLSGTMPSWRAYEPRRTQPGSSLMEAFRKGDEIGDVSKSRVTLSSFHNSHNLNPPSMLF